MTSAADKTTRFNYIEADIPPGITIDQWRRHRAVAQRRRPRGRTGRLLTQLLRRLR